MSLAEVQARIATACRRAGRDPAEVTLVAVTKGHDPDEIDAEVLAHGHRVLGENRVQEWRDKHASLPDAEWHFIGNLQRNKVKYLADGKVAAVHSLTSIKLADEMERQGANRGHRFRCYLEVNIADEDSKQGVDPDRVERLLEHCRGLDHVEVVGLMAMAPYSDDPETSRPLFRRLRTLAERLGLAGLSMGMSGDFEVAVEEGATVVRVGTAIFA